MKYRRKISMILGCSVYTVLAMEIFLRLFAPVPMLPRYVCATEYGIRGNEANKQYQHKTPEYRVHIKTNSKGIRAEQDIPYEKADGVKRIVVLGDSFGMGYGVDLENSFTSRMQHYLQQHGENVEIVNLSVSGHGNAEQLVLLTHEGFRYDPDLVLLQWHSTDIQDNVRSGLYKLNEGNLERKNQTYLPGVEMREFLFQFRGYRFLAEHSQLYNFFRDWAGKQVKKMLVSLRSEKGQASAADLEAAKQYRQELTLRIIYEMQLECQKRGASFMILDIPRPIGRLDFYSIFPDTVNDMYDFDYYCPIEDFRLYSGEKIYWEKSHGHLTPLGCDIVGRGLDRYIIENGLLTHDHSLEGSSKGVTP